MTKERPIIFNGDMVRAILDGRKTQTRRPLKFQPPNTDFLLSRIVDSRDRKNRGKLHWVKTNYAQTRIIEKCDDYFVCPFGQVGDRIWVRETWSATEESNIPDERPRTIGGGWTAGRDDPSSKACVIFRADGDLPDVEEFGGSHKYMWSPSIHMPRWASRITLEITDVRVERLQDVSEEDAECEGVETASSQEATAAHYKPAYQHLWDSIYGNWNENPWVWVIEFKRVEGQS